MAVKKNTVRHIMSGEPVHSKVLNRPDMDVSVNIDELIKHINNNVADRTGNSNQTFKAKDSDTSNKTMVTLDRADSLLDVIAGLSIHINTTEAHNLNKSQVGLGNVQNVEQLTQEDFTDHTSLDGETIEQPHNLNSAAFADIGTGPEEIPRKQDILQNRRSEELSMTSENFPLFISLPHNIVVCNGFDIVDNIPVEEEIDGEPDNRFINRYQVHPDGFMFGYNPGRIFIKNPPFFDGELPNFIKFQGEADITSFTDDNVYLLDTFIDLERPSDTEFSCYVLLGPFNEPNIDTIIQKVTVTIDGDYIIDTEVTQDFDINNDSYSPFTKFHMFVVGNELITILSGKTNQIVIKDKDTLTTLDTISINQTDKEDMEIVDYTINGSNLIIVDLSGYIYYIDLDTRQVVWNNTVTSQVDNDFTSVAFLPDKSSVVVGYKLQSNDFSLISIVKYNSLGQVISSPFQRNTNDTSFDYLYHFNPDWVVSDHVGNVYISGNFYEFSNDCRVLRFDSDLQYEGHVDLDSDTYTSLEQNTTGGFNGTRRHIRMPFVFYNDPHFRL